MSINLSKVNISLNEFQRLSIGEHNAGEVKLAGETKLAKMNHHVGSFFVNKDIISHEEVIAIKQALVKALSQNGVQEDTLRKIRNDLGLVAADPSDRDLRHRSIMPLTRKKIREILDQNAKVINAFNAQNGGDVRIRTSTHIYGPGGMDEARAAKRDAVNAKLVEYDRQVNVDQDIMRLQSILTNTADYAMDEERSEILAMAKAQLESLMEKCGSRPRADKEATATIDLQHGRTVSISTGMSEVEYTARLEDLILRFTFPGRTSPRPVSPRPVEHAVVGQYMTCDTDDKRKEFLDALGGEKRFGLKARALVVRCLYSRGVTDYETLDLANRLEDANALKLAKALLEIPADTPPDEIRKNAVLLEMTEMARKNPFDAMKGVRAYVPATSTAQYNEFVQYAMKNNEDLMLPSHRALVKSVKDEVRRRMGETGLPKGVKAWEMICDPREAGLAPEDADGENTRLTADAICGRFRNDALRKGALRILSGELKRAIGASGDNPDSYEIGLKYIEAKHPQLVQGIIDAGSPDNVKALLETQENKDLIATLVPICRESFSKALKAVNVSGDSSLAIATILLRGSGITEAEDPAREYKTRCNRITKSIMQMEVAKNIGSELRKDNHNKPIDKFNFEQTGTLFKKDLYRGLNVRFHGGEALPYKDYPGARDRFVKFITDDENATYETADEKTKLKAHVLISHATQNFFGSLQLGIGIAFHPEGKTGRVNINRVRDRDQVMEVNFSKDQDGNIVIGGDLTFQPPVISVTTEKSEQKLAAGDGDSYARHHVDIVIAKEDLEKCVNARWDDFDYEAIHDVERRIDMPHHHEAAADMLQGGNKLEYRKFDVSYDFHFDKLYEYNPAPNAPLRETTL